MTSDLMSQTPFFTKRSPHLSLAHHYWRYYLSESDRVVDATCGNGHDTLFLRSLIGGSGFLWALDLQEKAIEATKNLLGQNYPPEELQGVFYSCQSHETFPASLGECRLVVYNLGYLPGADKELTTQRTSTLVSLNCALHYLMSGGALSITCYPGHEEGEHEQEAIIQWAATLPPTQYHCCHHRFINRTKSATLLLIEKI